MAPQTADVLGGEYALVMGLLDDAIREHLDLKRRRGADPTEVERAEREALGPVRRGPDGPELVDPGLEEPLAYDHEAEEDWVEEFEEPDDGYGPQEAAHIQPFDMDEPHAAEEPAPSGGAYSSRSREFEEPLAAAPDQSAEPFADEGPVATPPRHTGSEPPIYEHPNGETVEYQVEAALEQEEPKDKDKDDVLEETPDFLQDTPDHDRLWFEQRPPRDFDFDG